MGGAGRVEFAMEFGAEFEAEFVTEIERPIGSLEMLENRIFRSRFGTAETLDRAAAVFAPCLYAEFCSDFVRDSAMTLLG